MNNRYSLVAKFRQSNTSKQLVAKPNESSIAFISVVILTLLLTSACSPEITSGTNTDIDGKFYMETTDKVDKLKVSYIGYKIQYIEIKPGQVNNITVSLIDEAIGLDEVVVKVEKYKNKDNPAVALIKKVIENKEKNRKENRSF